MAFPDLSIKSLMSYLRPLTTGLSRVTNPLFEGTKNKWVYPVFGAAAASPIIGYELDKRRKAQVAKEEMAKKRLADRQIERGANEKQARLNDLNLLRDVLRRAKAESGSAS
jgi:hypothetical protein